MKLLFDAERLRDPNSGLGQFCRSLGTALVAQRPAGAEMTFVVPPSHLGEFGPDTTYIATAWWQRYHAPARPDVWHATHQDVWVRPWGGARVVLSIMDLNFLERTDYSEAKKARRLAAVQRKIDRASAVATISEYTATVVRQHLRVGDTPLRVIHLASPVDTHSPLGDSPPHPALRGLRGERFFIFVGVLHPKKNVHTLLPVMREFPGWRLVLAGSDRNPYANDLREQARALGVEDRVLIPGTVDEATKRWLYANSAALLFPSLSEGFGIPVIEAMSFGKPAFISSLTSLPEIGGPHATYFDSFEPASMAATIREGLREYEANPARSGILRQHAARFSWRKAAEQYWELYGEVASLAPCRDR